MPSNAPKSPAPSTAFAILAALVGVGTASALLDDTRQDEGVRYVAYPDVGGRFTICSGTTTGVKAGDKATPEECDAKTVADLTKAARLVLRVSPMLAKHHNQLRAVIRFQNNTGKYPVSSAHRWFNAGNLRKGCDAMLAYNGVITLDRPMKGAAQVRQLSNANGHRRYFNVIRGLVNRRGREHAVCVSGLGQVDSAAATFRCGHPREPGNIYLAAGHERCALCQRIDAICRQHKRDQKRINEGTFYKLGERIVRGID